MFETPQLFDFTMRKSATRFFQDYFRAFFVVDHELQNPLPVEFFRTAFNEARRDMFPDGLEATDQQLTRFLHNVDLEVYDLRTKNLIPMHLRSLHVGRRFERVWLGVRPVLNTELSIISGGAVDEYPTGHPLLAADPLGQNMLSALHERGRMIWDRIYRSNRLAKWRIEELTKIHAGESTSIAPAIPLADYLRDTPLFPYPTYLNKREALLAAHRLPLHGVDKTQKLG